MVQFRPKARRVPSLGGLLAGLAVLAALAAPTIAPACTTVLVGRALTADGSVIHAHNEDMGNDAAGRVWWVTPARHDEGAAVAVPYVELAQPARTLGYWASGNVPGAAGLGTSSETRPYDSVLVGLNDAGVSMSCNWAHSREATREGVGIRRYALRQLLLERATSARHGVELLGRWIEEHGQADWGGLVYHLADAREAWVVETTTRNWVARRVRDDEIYVTANRFRIGADYDLASATLVADAVAAGWLATPGNELHFARVYGLPERMDEPYDTRREERVLELLGGKAGVIAPEDLFLVLRDRYQSTDRYAPPRESPSWRDDLAKAPSLSRPINTNLAQSSFVAHHRSDLPVAVGAVLWLGLATPAYAGHVPLYAGGGDLPPEFAADGPESSEGSAWGLFRRLQRAGDRDYPRHQEAVLTFWTARHAVALERQRRIESDAAARIERGDEAGASRLLGAFTHAQGADVLYHVRRLLAGIETRGRPAVVGAL